MTSHASPSNWIWQWHSPSAHTPRPEQLDRHSASSTRFVVVDVVVAEVVTTGDVDATVTSEVVVASSVEVVEVVVVGGVDDVSVVSEVIKAVVVLIEEE